MSERMHPVKAVRLQSSAVVLAAMITTGGAVLSALIQTASKPWAEAVESHAATQGVDIPLPSSAELDTIARRDPLSSIYLPQRQAEVAPQVAFNEPARLNEIKSVSFHAPSTRAEKPQPIEPMQWSVAKPNIAVASASQPMVSPWYYLSHQEASVAQQPQRPVKKFDWNSVTKLFSWHN